MPKEYFVLHFNDNTVGIVSKDALSNYAIKPKTHKEGFKSYEEAAEVLMSECPYLVVTGDKGRIYAIKTANKQDYPNCFVQRGFFTFDKAKEFVEAWLEE